MTDPQNWLPPEQDRRGGPSYGERTTPVGPPVAPPGRPPAPGAPAGWAPSPEWTPPPRPGLIPLRPLGFGTLLRAPFQVLRRNPKATFGSALIVQGGIVLLSLVTVGAVSFFALARIDSAPITERDAVQAGSMVTIALSALLPIALSLVAGALLEGVIVVEVARATLGEKLRLGALWRAAGRRLWPLVLWTGLLAAAATLALALVAGGVVLFVALGGAWIAAGIGVGIVGVMLFLAGAVWLGTKTSLVPGLIVLEHLGLKQSVRRSWSLTDGYFWRTLGVEFLVAAIVNIVTQIVLTPLSILFPIVVSFIDPNSSFDAYIPAVALYVLSLVIALVMGAITSVVQAGTIALIYIDLRMRKEGLDLDLQRFVEAEPGEGLADPYLPRVRPGAAAPRA